jgi:F-type H+-transporting ATPase subunit gamma
MAQLRELKGRIKAVGNIKRITKTMQMIATAKFQASSRRAMATKPYTQKVTELVGELAAAAGSGEIGHPLLGHPEPSAGRQLLLILTSNRGLCGAYNANVLRTAAGLIRVKRAAGVEMELEVVGKKGLAYCRFNGLPVGAAHGHIGDPPGYEDVEALAETYMSRFTSGRLDAVRVAYMRFISNSRQEPTVQTLLPTEPPAADARARRGMPIYDFSPAPDRLLDALLPAAVKAQLFQAFNDAQVSEQLARMVAMGAATDNAESMGKRLTRTYNRARQAQITTELTEIVSGAAALG